MGSKILKIIGMAAGGLALGVILAFFFGWLVMLLWNWIMPPVFGLGTITFWQAWGLVILAHLLFKAGGHEHFKHDGPPWKHKFHDKVKEHLFADKNASAPAKEQ